MKLPDAESDFWMSFAAGPGQQRNRPGWRGIAQSRPGR